MTENMRGVWYWVGVGLGVLCLGGVATPQSNASVFRSLFKKEVALDPLVLPQTPEEVTPKKTLALTLEEAVVQAEKQNQEIQIATRNIESSRLALQEARSSLYPVIDFNAGLTRSFAAEEEINSRSLRRFGETQARNAQQVITTLESNLTNLQAQPIPDRATDPVGFIERGLAVQGLENDLSAARAELGQALANFNSVPFATTSLRADLTLTYNLFTFGRREREIEAAENQIRISEQSLRIITEQTRLAVTIAYYDLQDAREQLRIEQATINEAVRSRADAAALKDAGLGTRFDELTATVQLDAAQQRFALAQSQERIASSRLAELLNLPPEVAITAADSPDRIAGIWKPTLEETIVYALQNRAELQQQLTQRKLLEQQRERVLANLAPNISLQANYNALLANSDNPAEIGVIRGFGTGYTLGVNVTWNFFDAGRARASADQLEKSREVAALRFSQLGTQIRREVQEAYALLRANEKNIATARLALARAEASLRLARLRFQAGVGSQIDTLVTETNLTTAQVNLSRAILGYNRALASLQRATGYTLSGDNGNSTSP